MLLIPMMLAISVGEVPNPRASHDGWVTDMAEQIPTESEAELEAVLDKLHADLGVEVAVVTVQSVPGVPKTFATELFERWGIGNRDRNDGLLILLAMESRRLEMETGYGLEGRLPDSWVVRMQREHMVPLFKQGEFGKGLVVGVEQIDQRLRAAAAGESQPSTSTNSPDYVEEPYVYEPGLGQQIGDFFISPKGFVFVFFGFLGLALFFRWMRRRPYTLCSACGEDRLLLPEEEEDEHLSKGQQTEEEIGSITYDVWVCPACFDVAIDSKKRWSSYVECRKCDRRTMTTQTKTLKKATTSAQGKAQITENCKNCSHSRTFKRKIPRVVVSTSTSSSSSSSYSWSSSSSSSSSSFSSSSYSGGSSFGGGSSGGGGGGSSW